MTKTETVLVKKAWGTEEIISNKAHCCKFLHVEPNKVCSLHKHIKKTEDFYCLAGEGVVEISGEIEKITVGDIIEVPTGAYHCFATATGMTLIESSTHHDDADVVRANASAELDQRKHWAIWEALGLPKEGK
jgi:mannose-6-phosphate isomerase-like protein (cupin superfamily)